METASSKRIAILTAITYLVMVIMNALANALPINGKITGDISDGYPNLFAPAGVTFVIWGVIYLLLGLYTLHQLGAFQQESPLDPALRRGVGTFFSISSLANACWILAWHYEQIAISMVLMLVILICLIRINQLVDAAGLSRRARWFVAVPFAVYLGWITVATVANATTLLVAWGVDGLSESAPAITIGILLVAAAIALAVIRRFRSVAYALVLVWAYIGILLKHTLAKYYAGEYTAVIVAVIACLALFVVALVGVLRRPGGAAAA